MRMIVHAGMHKAASTSFQELCAENRSALISAGIHYPLLEDGKPDHNHIPHLMDSGQWDEVERILHKAIGEQAADAKAVLLSAEDFENCLRDVHLAKRFEDLALAAGVTEVRWHFVIREPWAYFNSLYAELCKHGISTSYADMLNEVLATNSYACANSGRRWYFEFDYDAGFERLSDGVSGCVEAIDFKTFCRDGVGRPLLLAIAEGENIAALGSIYEQAAEQTRSNPRKSALAVEYRYLCNGFSLNPKRFSPVKKVLLAPLVLYRLWQKRTTEKRMKQRFQGQFPAA